MDNAWLTSALWMAMALIASLISIRLAVSVALVEIMVGTLFGNIFPLSTTPWINYLAGVGSIILTFLAGAEIDPAVVRKHLLVSVSIGIAGFFFPFVGVLAFCHFVARWTWNASQIAGLALSTTSVAVVYAVMLETGLNRTEIGKIILAACFINDLGTVLGLGILFANYDAWLALFVFVTIGVLIGLRWFVPWFFSKVGSRISEPETKFVLLTLFLLGGIGNKARMEAVLPAYLVGMVLAPFFLKERVLAQRMRVLAFTLFTPFFFLKAGALVRLSTVFTSAGLITLLLALKMATKAIGILPLTKIFKFAKRDGAYTTLMMSTGLTFGSICALFGLNNAIIDSSQYTILVTAVIGSAVIPTIIAQRRFEPNIELLEEANTNA